MELSRVFSSSGRAGCVVGRGPWMGRGQETGARRALGGDPGRMMERFEVGKAEAGAVWQWAHEKLGFEKVLGSRDRGGMMVCTGAGGKVGLRMESQHMLCPQWKLAPHKGSEAEVRFGPFHLPTLPQGSWVPGEPWCPSSHHTRLWEGKGEVQSRREPLPGLDGLSSSRVCTWNSPVPWRS